MRPIVPLRSICALLTVQPGQLMGVLEGSYPHYHRPSPRARGRNGSPTVSLGSHPSSCISSRQAQKLTEALRLFFDCK